MKGILYIVKGRMNPQAPPAASNTIWGISIIIFLNGDVICVLFFIIKDIYFIVIGEWSNRPINSPGTTDNLYLYI